MNIENDEPGFEELGYETISMPCPNCGCDVMEKESFAFTDTDGNGEVIRLDRVCPCCDWWDITYDG